MNHFSIPLELLATLTGLTGAWYVAAEDRRHAAWGFAAFLASNAAWIAFGYINSHWILIAQQVGFTGLSLRGIWIKALRPRLAALFDIWEADHRDEPTVHEDLMRAAAYLAAEDDAGSSIDAAEADRIAAVLRAVATSGAHTPDGGQR